MAKITSRSFGPSIYIVYGFRSRGVHSSNLTCEFHQATECAGMETKERGGAHRAECHALKFKGKKCFCTKISIAIALAAFCAAMSDAQDLLGRGYAAIDR